MNRIFGLLTQWGLRVSLARLRAADAIELLDERIAPLERELRQAAPDDQGVVLLRRSPASATFSA